MCIAGESESGHGGRFEPCAACKRLQEENAALRQEIAVLRINRAQLEHAVEVVEALRQERDTFLDIAKKIAVIFVYGDFVAETPAERKLEKMMREAGIWWESVEEYESQWLVGDRHAG